MTCARRPFFATKQASIAMMSDLPSPVPTRASIVLGKVCAPSAAPLIAQVRNANINTVMSCTWCGIITTLKRFCMHSAAAEAISSTSPQSLFVKDAPLQYTGPDNFGAAFWMISRTFMSASNPAVSVPTNGDLYTPNTAASNSQSSRRLWVALRTSHLNRACAMSKSSLPMYSNVKMTWSSERNAAAQPSGFARDNAAATARVVPCKRKGEPRTFFSIFRRSN
mmetsp:Transcript_45484/g.132412  ORF Transcript_45484/g.132412 Transcript_45484/m.132412 type:complete len:223 (+) Transcript_45484:200-868(+)